MYGESSKGVPFPGVTPISSRPPALGLCRRYGHHQQDERRNHKGISMGQRAGSPGIRRSKICLTRDIVRLVEATMPMGRDSVGGKRHLTPPRCPVCYTWAESVTRQSCRSQPVAICQKRPSLTLGLEIAQAPIGQANGRGVPPDIEFSVGRAMDLESVGTLVAHLISPIRFRRSGLSCQ
jgi:hypothetical protein